jgi:hypothetical protein
VVINWFGWSGFGRLGIRRRPARGNSYDGYVEELSAKLYHQTLDAGGAAADIGVFGPALFRGDAQRMIHEIGLGSAAGGPPSP